MCVCMRASRSGGYRQSMSERAKGGAPHRCRAGQGTQHTLVGKCGSIIPNITPPGAVLASVTRTHTLAPDGAVRLSKLVGWEGKEGERERRDGQRSPCPCPCPCPTPPFSSTPRDGSRHVVQRRASFMLHAHPRVGAMLLRLSLLKGEPRSKPIHGGLEKGPQSEVEEREREREKVEYCLLYNMAASRLHCTGPALPASAPDTSSNTSVWLCTALVREKDMPSESS